MIRRVLVLSIVAAALAGCEPHYSALTTPPPFAKAELCDGQPSCGDAEAITLTKGIALAFDCRAAEGGACKHAKATVKDPEIATVFDGYLDMLSSSNGYNAQTATQTAFVVVGKSVGKTTLTVSSDAGATVFSVSVESL